VTLIELILIILTLILSLIAIKISFQFDINLYLRDRREIKKNQLMNICPHTRIIDIQDKKVHMQSLFSSPVGTRHWICNQCGLVVDSDEVAYELMARYGKHPMKLMENQNKFIKSAKKLKII